MDKKPKIAVIISIVSVVISLLSLLLAYVIYYESKTIVFKWEAHSENGILVKLEEEWINEEGKFTNEFFLPIWIKFQVTNTGSKAFSVDSLWLFVDHLNKNPKMWKQYTNLLQSAIINYKINDDGIIGDEASFPMAVAPGHSLVFYEKIRLNIPIQLYDMYKNSFKGKPFTIGDVYRLSNKNFHISKYFYISAGIDLAGGQYKQTHVGVDEEIELY